MKTMTNFPFKYPKIFLLLAAIAWLGLYQVLTPLAELIVHALPIERENRLGSALQFFSMNPPKCSCC
jgi:hypothetical protein